MVKTAVGSGRQIVIPNDELAESLTKRPTSYEIVFEDEEDFVLEDF